MTNTVAGDAETRARVRHKHWLLRRWEERLEAVDAPGEAHLVTNYRPQGLSAPADVGEIAGLVVLDADRTAHHFRLFRDERIKFIESPQGPEAPIAIDPLSRPVDHRTYLSAGVPAAVTERVDALEVSADWRDACDDGAHEFYVEGEGSPYAQKYCERCGLARSTVSWLGHAVPRPPGGEQR